MPRFLVYTPVYTVYSYDQMEPPEQRCDSVIVEAKDKREAIKLGVKQMLLERMDYVMDQRRDGCSPYTGVKAE